MMNTRKGFTLIETLVAISILVLSLAGPLSIASKALQSAYYARDEVTAYYLAQEGLEYARAVRDQNRLAGLAWTSTLDSCVSPAVCVVDFPLFTRTVVTPPYPALLVSASSGLYNQTSGTPSHFTRTLTVTNVNANEIKVTVTVTWTSGNINRSFGLSEDLLNWI